MSHVNIMQPGHGKSTPHSTWCVKWRQELQRGSAWHRQRRRTRRTMASTSAHGLCSARAQVSHQSAQHGIPLMRLGHGHALPCWAL